jgi:hypothetical protein
MIDLKFGKKDATADAKDLLFGDYVAAVLPTSWPKPNFGEGTLFRNWLMLGNDEVGDCVIASRAHLTMLDTRVGAAQKAAPFTTASAISEYSAVGGYVPGDPSTDNGLDMRVMCAYQKNTGLKDAAGVRHKIGAYLALTPGNTLQMIQATWLFGGFGLGFQVPQSAVDQFNAGSGIWTDVGDTNIVGGHEVCGVGTMDWHSKLTIVTWAVRWQMTFGFISAYNDEAWAWVPPEILSAGGTWRGLNVAKLNEDLAAL